MCSICNARLNSFIELPAKDLIRSLIPWNEPHHWPKLDSEACLAASRWFLKVGLLMTHPEAVHDNPKVHGSPEGAYFDDACLDWMRNEDLPPEGFSVFVTRRPVSAEALLPDEELELGIPSVAVDGVDLHFTFRTFGIRGLDVAIVWHPGWPLKHPLVEAGRAVRLWPSAASVDLSVLPVVHPNEFRFVDAHISSFHFTKEGFERVTQTPLSIENDAMSVFPLKE